ncbi:peptidoglycan hydrolase-like protein with peptidoglycan-binding domain [Hoeflea halophila]|uniref:Peptidoglycan hydrolase-like protein with peptidoglycan-binding domain n=1 Tax=Hoeflea halophila TaxID=714899 RepID=A0A286IBP6_9HYPH|nr:peptidoglycan-binding domain-containing protein [Hoeflea halophila]SOE17492.1 peptidoglycan hydrolase-like protein with peptidoglycan-binding domain [Hoeflea halophila]
MPRQRVSPDLIDDETDGQGILGLLGSVISAHPSLAGGSVAFAVIFGFVATNALWHQPGQHPAPILKTRDVASAGSARVRTPSDTMSPLIKGAPTRIVTTYRIERSDETPTASIPVPNPPAPAAPAVTPEVSATPASDRVLTRIQTVLAEKGLYSGEIDGLMGPKSEAAIRAWERNNGYTETGEPSASLLSIMEQAGAQTRQAAAPAEIASSQPVARPAPRPAPAVASDARAGEPVTVPAEPVEGPSELVQQIQSGLSNIAYADITVDGVAGSQTRAAISAFEKHYRLPVTGEPNETVLKKLLEIGAL